METLICPVCDDNRKYNDYTITCLTCGLIEYAYVQSLPYKQNQVANPVNYKVIYKRINYFTKLLKNLNGKNIPSSIIHDKIVDKIKKDDFNTFNQLRKLFKLNKLSTYYDYLFYYWNYFKGNPLIQLNNYQMKLMIRMFKTFDRTYSRVYSNKRYLMNYQFLIRKFFIEINLKKYCKYIKKHNSKIKFNELEEMYDIVVNNV